MPGLTFDTHKSVKALKAAGFQELQAEALVDEIQKLQDSAIANLATKDDIAALKGDIAKLDSKTQGSIRELELRMEAKFESAKGEMTLLKWMIGFVLAGVVSLILKAFFV